jgi:hypothetical protein
MKVRLSPVQVAGKGPLSVGRIGLAGVEALNDLRLGVSDVLGQARYSKYQEYENGGNCCESQ